MTRNVERSQVTRSHLITAAQKHFGKKGYAATSTADVVRAAAVTRGALYHHFRSKEDLFRGVYERTQEEMAIAVRAEAAGLGVWEGLVGTCKALLDAWLEPAAFRIVLVDANAVLPWDVQRQAEAQHALGALRERLGEAITAGFVPEQPVEPLSLLLRGSLAEAAMAIAASEDTRSARREIGASVLWLLHSLCP